MSKKVWEGGYTSSHSRGMSCILGMTSKVHNVRDRSLITTWGGRQIVRANAANFSVPPYANRAKISVPSDD